MIDCDVHQNFNDVGELVPWLDPAFRDMVQHGGYGGFTLPAYPWMHPEGFTRHDAVPPGGGVPGSDYEALREQLLDAFDVEAAVLTGEEILTVSAMPHAQLAAALAGAYNRWLTETWLPRDHRLRGSLIVATQDAQAAAREIHLHGDHPAIVQVLLPVGNTQAYGRPHFHPIYEAAIEHDLAVAMHAGVAGVGVTPPPTPTGYPDYYIEWHTQASSAAAASHLISLVCHGTFERYPELRIAVIETGVVWLPGILWRLDANWKALRSEVPWVTRAPSETIREQVRFSTQPLEQPADPRALTAVLQAVDGLDEMLMFATDYPHWDFDTPELIARRLPRDWRAKVMADNARAFYRLPTPARERPPAAAGAR